VTNLIADTTPNEATPASAPVISPAGGSLAGQTPANVGLVSNSPAPAATTAPANLSVSTANGNVTIANKKIITPIGSEPKKDLNTLLALEEAKQTDGVPVPPPAPAPGQAPAAPQTPPAPGPAPAPAQPAAPNDPLDPNSIAL
jgi:hypothetical protein